MNLIIDVGNTFVKIAAFSEGRILYQLQIPAEELVEEIDKILLMYPGIKSAILASVTRMDEDQLRMISEKTELYIVDHQLKTPFENRYSSPETLGTDRIALAASAVLHYGGTNTLVIDAGTCVTYDMITEDAVYLGGAISPGLLMRYRALHQFTDGLPGLEPGDNHDLIGKTTEESIHSGVVNGLCMEIEGVIGQYQSRYELLTVILTGGDAQFLSKRLKKAIFAHSNFLLEGLNFLLEYNKR